MTTATKTKRTLLRDECISPPREIRENTKDRRQWLAEKLAEVSALPNREAKIVGTGSYQSINVYRVETVNGRLRFRGICQFCGNSQVVSDGVLVLHGYERPGDGRVWGQCPGMGLPPLNADKSRTEKWLTDAIATHGQAEARLQQAKATKKIANNMFYADENHALRMESYTARPAALRTRPEPTADEKSAYQQEYQAWAEKYPLAAASAKADRNCERARQMEWQAESNRRHFQHLIDSNVFGTSLKEEVVT